MKMKINPYALVEGKPVKVSILQNEENPDIAWMQCKGNIFHVYLNEPSIKKFYTSTWVSEKVSYEYYKLGILLHEFCHIVYDNEPYRQKDPLYHHIFNMLDDPRIEYHLSRTFPALGKTLCWVLASIERNLDTKKVVAREEEHLEELNKQLKTLFRVSRFGVIKPEDDMKFVSFFLPLTLSSSIGDMRNCYHAVDLIYYYLMNEINDTKMRQSMQNASSTIDPLGEESLEEIMDKAQTYADNGIRQVAIAQEEENTIEVGQLGGEGSTHIEILEDNSFVLSTLKKRSDEIHAIHTAIRLLRQKWNQTNEYEGEYNFSAQEQAYQDSFTWEENPTFLGLQKIVPSLRFTLIRDVSYSTSGISQEYAEACVMLLAGMEDITGISTIQVDFSDDAIVVKKPEQSVMTSSIYPNIVNGTEFIAAIKLLQALDVKEEQHVVCVVTDGDFNLYSKKHGKEYLEKYVESQHVDCLFFVYIGEYQKQDILGYPVFSTDVPGLVGVIYEVVERLL
jgi:hypothetical protein